MRGVVPKITAGVLLEDVWVFTYIWSLERLQGHVWRVLMKGIVFTS